LIFERGVVCTKEEEEKNDFRAVLGDLTGNNQW